MSELGRSPDAAGLLPAVYDELRRLAAHQLAAEPSGQTLDATALVHEAYLRLAAGSGHRWEGPRHFFNAAALAMRRILVDRARARLAQKRGGGQGRVDLESTLAAPAADVDLVALDDALTALSEADPQAAELVEPLQELALAQLGLEKFEQAEATWRECLAIQKRHTPEAWERFDTESLLGASLAAQGEYARAEPLLLSGYEGVKARRGQIAAADRRRLTDAAERLAKFYDAWDKPAEARKWRAEQYAGAEQLPRPRELKP